MVTQRAFRIGLLGFLALGLMSCGNELAANTCLDAADCDTGFCRDGFCAACSLDTDCDGVLCVDGVCDLSGLPTNPDGEGEVGGGVVRISPEGAVDFGSPVVGTPVERTVSVLNFGSEAFDVLGVAATPAEFSVNAELPVTLEPGERVEIILVYENDDDVADTGTAIFRTTAGSCDPACADPSAITVDLTSAFLGGAADLVVSPPAIDFGTVAPGEVSPERAVVLRNNAELDAVLRVTGIAPAGDDDQFEIDFDPAPLFLGAGQSLSIPVRYAPTAGGDHAAQIAITAESTDPNARSFLVELSGRAAAGAALDFDPPAIAFPAAGAGQTVQRTSTLTNTSGAPVTVDQLVVDGNAYAAFAGAQLPYTIAPGASLEVFVDYTGQGGDAPTGSVRAGEATLGLSAEFAGGNGFTQVEIVSGPEDNPLTEDNDCVCQATGNIPAANIDLSYVAAGQVCAKPGNVACGLNGGTCDCSGMGTFGSVGWGAGRQETVRGDVWVVDEKIVHSGVGQDGTFVARVDLLDDCLAVPGSTAYAVNHSCCFMDCESMGQQCYPYGFAPICASECEFLASQATSQDCLMRGPITIRTTVTLSGNGTEVRQFCTTLNSSGQAADVVSITRQGGAFTVGSVRPGSVEVQPGQPCQ
jgi:hypothetical protein